MFVEQHPRDNSTYRYRVTRFLHKDRRGVLLAGIDPVNGADVALRQIDLRQFDERTRTDYLWRLACDIDKARSFCHPAVVTPYSLHVEGDDAFIVMASLGEALPVAIMHKVPPERAVALVCQILDALVRAHERRVLLHELRLRNFFATPSGQARIIEFGLVPGDVGDVLDAQRARAEEAAMMSPEHCVGEPLGPRSDLFSIGCLLYRLIAGNFPFEGLDYTTTVSRIVRMPHAPLGIDWLDPIIDRALAKKPTERFVSATAFSHALQAGGLNSIDRPATDADIAAAIAVLNEAIGPIAPFVMRRILADQPSAETLRKRCAEY